MKIESSTAAIASRSQRRAVSGEDLAVFGATGHTGRFVVAELLRRGILPVAVARDLANLASLGLRDRDGQIRVASIDEAGSLDRAFDDVAAVINCAGPFLDTADAVAAAALRAAAHCLDVTAEQPSARATLEKFEAAAREAGVIVIPAMGFYGGLGDLLATAAVGSWSLDDEIRIANRGASWSGQCDAGPMNPREPEDLKSTSDGHPISQHHRGEQTRRLLARGDVGRRTAAAGAAAARDATGRRRVRHGVPGRGRADRRRSPALLLPRTRPEQQTEQTAEVAGDEQVARLPPCCLSFGRP
jgi:hypothetical protein